MKTEWIKIYTSNDYFKAELVRQVLVDQDIEAVLLDKQGYPYRIGEVEVHIHKDHFQQALEIIIRNEL